MLSYVTVTSRLLFHYEHFFTILIDNDANNTLIISFVTLLQQIDGRNDLLLLALILDLDPLIFIETNYPSINLKPDKTACLPFQFTLESRSSDPRLDLYRLKLDLSRFFQTFFNNTYVSNI